MPNTSNSENHDAGENFISHLIALRRCVVRASASIVLVFLSIVYWAPTIFHFFAQPLLAALPKGATMIVTDVTGSFMVPMKVTLMVAFMLALPYVLYQLWSFIAPGLYRHEKRWILPLVSSSYILFVGGVIFAYFLVFPSIFHFMVQYNGPLGVQMATDVDKYLTFAITTFLAFGISFEVPIIVIVLNRLGIVSREKLKAIRPYVVVGAFVIAAVVTPPDVLSQLLLAIPLWLLFELGLCLSSWFTSSSSPKTDNNFPKR